VYTFNESKQHGQQLASCLKARAKGQFVTIVELLAAIRADPQRYLEVFSAEALGKFFAGYQHADAGFEEIAAELRARHESDGTRGPYVGAYLRFRDRAEGAANILDELLTIARALNPSSRPGSDAERDSFSLVSDAVSHGRPGMLIGEPSVEGLFHFCQGFQCGLDVVSPERAVAHAKKFREFEAWLESEHIPGRWCRVLRIHHGAGLDGIQAFVSLWAEFEELAQVLPARLPS
jgi:hypothetical protein